MQTIDALTHVHGAAEDFVMNVDNALVEGGGEMPLKADASFRELRAALNHQRTCEECNQPTDLENSSMILGRITCHECASNSYSLGDAAIGRDWRRDSSLEKWFPITAEQLKEQQSALDLMVDEFARIKAISSMQSGIPSSEIFGICERAISRVIQAVPLIQQRDELVAENLKLRLAAEDWDAVKRENEALKKFVIKRREDLINSEPKWNDGTKPYEPCSICGERHGPHGGVCD